MATAVQATTTATVRSSEYETIYVLRPDVAPESAARVARRVEEVVAREGGKLTLVETWGRRQLAYAVGRYRRGIYLYVRYVGFGGIVSELERNLRMLDDVIKFITVQVRADVELETLAVDEDSIRFDAIEIPVDEEPEPTLAETLGLVPSQGDRSEQGRWGRDRAASESAEGEEAEDRGPPSSSDLDEDAGDESSEGPESKQEDMS
jgi:small subunit ribosomal protein S6